ncbi:MAG: hypothetical protein AVDCRST_MAG66-2030, partial [uncultured Pseudonocardia sp.]
GQWSAGGRGRGGGDDGGREAGAGPHAPAGLAGAGAGARAGGTGRAGAGPAAPDVAAARRDGRRRRDDPRGDGVRGPARAVVVGDVHRGAADRRPDRGELDGSGRAPVDVAALGTARRRGGQGRVRLRHRRGGRPAGRPRRVPGYPARAAGRWPPGGRRGATGADPARL